jgi:hypothetical protein
MKTKRKDKTRKAKYQQSEHKAEESGDIESLGKSLFLLVEGETEAVYFEKLKQNPHLKQRLAGVDVKSGGNFKSADEACSQQSKGKHVWLVSDNDKRNAFILEENGSPFFRNLTDEQLPKAIRDRLNAAYDSDRHNYFLSISDYFSWLKEAIGINNMVEFWDKIEHFTPKKVKEFDTFFNPKFNQNKEPKFKIAYSCIAFEFWLILHFEQNDTPFLWVDKGKDKSIDVVTYFRNLLKENQIYGKGSNNLCNAYTCLYPDYQKEDKPTKDDEWQVLIRIFNAIQNAAWLRNKMLPILKRQSRKWWEVNPYIEGLDVLMKELLNIKPLGEPVEYSDLTVKFDFDSQSAQLTLEIDNVSNAFSISVEHASFFKVKDGNGNEYEPTFEGICEFPNSKIPVKFQYHNLQDSVSPLVLIFKDPRIRSKSGQLFFILAK